MGQGEGASSFGVCEAAPGSGMGAFGPLCCISPGSMYEGIGPGKATWGLACEGNSKFRAVSVS